MIRVTTNTDRSIVDDIRAKIKENNGHCACAVSFNENNMCICKDFRDQIEREEPGECHCGLYTIEIV